MDVVTITIAIDPDVMWGSIPRPENADEVIEAWTTFLLDFLNRHYTRKRRDAGHIGLVYYVEVGNAPGVEGVDPDEADEIMAEVEDLTEKAWEKFLGMPVRLALDVMIDKDGIPEEDFEEFRNALMRNFRIYLPGCKVEIEIVDDWAGWYDFKAWYPSGKEFDDGEAYELDEEIVREQIIWDAIEDVDSIRRRFWCENDEDDEDE